MQISVSMALKVEFRKVSRKGEIELTLSGRYNRLHVPISKKIKVREKTKELFEWMNISRTKRHFLIFDRCIQLYAVQTISPMIIRHNFAIVAFRKESLYCSGYATVVGRLLGLMPLLRLMSFKLEQEMELINLMNCLNFHHRKVKCELDIDIHYAIYANRRKLGVVSHILKDKLQSHGFVLSEKSVMSPLGRGILKGGLVRDYFYQTA